MKQRIAALLRTLKSGQFWLVLGTVLFIGFSVFGPRHHFTRQEIEDCEADNYYSATDYHRNCTPPSEWSTGFLTACIVGAVWFLTLRQLSPPTPKDGE